MLVLYVLICSFAGCWVDGVVCCGFACVALAMWWFCCLDYLMLVVSVVLVLSVCVLLAVLLVFVCVGL